MIPIIINNNEVDIPLQRKEDNKKTSLGEITIGDFKILSLEDTGRDFNHDGDFDEPGEGKVYGETRILADRYELKFRTEGHMHEVYKDKYPWHRGMLELQDVPYFKYVLIHTGNQAGDTKACIITGSHKVTPNWVDDSEKAYLAFSGYVYCLFDLGYRVFINIIDENE
jgi:hypothetical protein